MICLHVGFVVVETKALDRQLEIDDDLNTRRRLPVNFPSQQLAVVDRQEICAALSPSDDIRDRNWC